MYCPTCKCETIGGPGECLDCRRKAKINNLESSLAQAQADLGRVTADLATEREKRVKAEERAFDIEGIIGGLIYRLQGEVNSTEERVKALSETAPTQNARSEKEADHD